MSSEEDVQMLWQTVTGPYVEFSQTLVLVALNVLVQSTVVIVIGLMAAQAVRSRGSALGSAIYRTTLVAAILCPAASLGLAGLGMQGPVVSLPALRARASGDVGVRPPLAERVATVDPALGHTPAPSAIDYPAVDGRAHGADDPYGRSPMEVQRASVAGQSAPAGDGETRAAGRASMFIPAACGLALAWTLVASVLLLRVAVGYGCLVRLRALACLPDPDALSQCRAVAERMGLRAPAVLRCPLVSSPVLIGWLRPAVLLPEDGSLAGPALGRVLVHEMAHLARHDCLWNLLCRMTTAAFFFQPLLWCLTRRIEHSAEEVCDDCVVDFGIDRRDYARELVAIAERHRDRVSLAAVGVVSIKSRLGHRVARILDPSRRLSTAAGRRAVLATALVGLVAAMLVGLVRLDEGRAQAAGVPAGSDSPADEPARPSATVPGDSGEPKSEAGESSSSSAIARAAAFRDRPRTEADRIVAAARARSLGLGELPRFLLRGTYWNAPVVDMQKLPERSLENLWKVRDREVNISKRYGSKAALAWDGARLVLRTDRAFLDDTASPPYTSCHYWDGAQGWWGNLSEDSRTVGRYQSIGNLITDSAWIYFPNFRALSNRLSWPGDVLALEHEPAHPSLARYERVGAETIDDQPCDVFDGPARFERVWIERSTGRLKAVYRRSLHRVHPNYYTELVQEIAGQTFEDRKAFLTWTKQQPEELQAVLHAYWGEVHWPLTEPSNLLVFSDYRQVAPGVEWPMRCERLLVGYAGRRAEDGFDYTRCEIVYEEAATEAPFDPLVAVTLPRKGDKIWDHRFDVPVDYGWDEGLTEAYVQGLVDAKRRELQESQAIIDQLQRPLNDMIGKPAPKLPETGWLVEGDPPIAKRLDGRPYLLHFWATWCGPCKNELPMVQSLHESGFTVIGVHPGGGGDEEAKRIQGFLREQGLECPQLLAAKDGENLAGYPVRMYPYTVVVDAEGRVAAHGFMKPELIATLRKLGGKKQP